MGIRKPAAVALAGLLLLASIAMATVVNGTVTATNRAAGTYPSDTRVIRYDFAWTSTAGGDVSGQTLTIRAGHIIQAQFVPGTGGTQPSDLYDAVFNDVNSVDLLSGKGANLSNSASTWIQLYPSIYYDGLTALSLVISNAGSAKTGVFTIWVAP